ncbi:MAG: hypothetical protein IJ746_00200 [Ruminococcus sp.]|nr:hypothetical protein [Ruminococcus sp.]
MEWVKKNKEIIIGIVFALVLITIVLVMLLNTEERKLIGTWDCTAIERKNDYKELEKGKIKFVFEDDNKIKVIEDGEIEHSEFKVKDGKLIITTSDFSHYKEDKYKIDKLKKNKLVITEAEGDNPRTIYFKKSDD